MTQPESSAGKPAALRGMTLGGLRPGRVDLSESWLYLALLGIVVGFWIWGGSGFFALENFRNILFDTSVIAMLAIGMAYLIIAGHFDLSVGSMLIFSSVVAAKVMVALAGTTEQVQAGIYPHATIAIVAGVLAAIVAGAAWGVVNGLLVVKKGLPSFIVTLGTLGAALSLAQVLSQGANISYIPPAVQSSFGGRLVLGVPLLVIIAAVAMVIAWYFLAKTRFGRWTYAIGSNREAARRAGINVDRHTFLLFVLMGVLAGAAGAMDLARFNTTSIGAHANDNLAAIAAVVIGGASLHGGSGSIPRTAVGVLIPAVLANGFIIVGVEPYWQGFAIGAVLIIAVSVDQSRRHRLATAGSSGGHREGRPRTSSRSGSRREGT
ncbi:MAG TPA: ABC transporter permease [Solirubrobacteraceae bacterium]|nr:ABC transporter permease [Solirubrobacteraceae bacterium]